MESITKHQATIKQVESFEFSMIGYQILQPYGIVMKTFFRK